MMDYSIPETVAQIINELDRGNSVSITSFAQQIGANKEALRKRFKSVVDRYYSEYVYYDKHAQLWLPRNKDFLARSFIDAEEAVILDGIQNKANHYGANLERRVHLIVNNYTKRRYYGVLHAKSIEDVEPMLDNFSVIQHAIKSSRMIEIDYQKPKRELNTKTILPIRIANMEYYWYLIGEESEDGIKVIKYFTARNIVNVRLLSDEFNNLAYKHLLGRVRNVEKGMNAFYEPFLVPIKIEVLIPEWFSGYIKSAPFFSLWNDTGRIKEIEDALYYIYTIDSTHPKYMDVIPTILKYMPNVVVVNNEANKRLIEMMKEASTMYAKILAASIN